MHAMNRLEEFAQLALEGVHREYPYHLSKLVMGSDPIESPRAMTPVFFGCFDWHSAVHGHWLLALMLRLRPDTECASRCHEALARSFNHDAIRTEADHLAQRPGFERPYGLAWLLYLIAELHQHDSEDACEWRRSLEVLESTARDHLLSWLPKLSWPIRSGTHAQTAFSMALVWDWAQIVKDPEASECIRSRAMSFYGKDRDYALHLEPSGEDFLSDSLGTASLMSRLLDTQAFTEWLDRVLPHLARNRDLEPVTSPDPSDGRLAHLDGLNLSRAWMLMDISNGIGPEDVRYERLRESAKAHARQGLSSVSSEHYAGSHWLGTFAAYLALRMPDSII